MFGVYEQLVHELGCRDHRGVVLLGCGPEISHFALPDRVTVLVLRHVTGNPQVLEANLGKVLEAHVQGRLQLVAAGGDIEARAVLGRCVKKTGIGRKIELLAVDDRGELWKGPGARPGRDLQAALDDVRRNPGKLRLDAAGFQSWLQERAEAAKQTVERIRSYQKTMLGRAPIATRVLVATIALVFVLELVWGGSRSVQTLVRMGGLVGEGPRAAELWRPLSTSFLHGGLMHLAGNLLVLFLIGSFLERLVGPWRLLVLWTVSVAGGSIAALLFSDAALMVGASGGGWGLMCAAGVLTLRPSGLIPQEMAIPLRKNVGQILLLNLMISFIPGIALSAHLGGGLAGALVALTGLSTLGMKTAEHAVTSTSRDLMSAPVTAAGAVAALLLYGSLVLGLVQGQPWLSGADGPWETHELGTPSLTIELPSALGQPTEKLIDSQTRELVYGDGLTGDWVVTVRVARFVPKILTSLRLFREYRALKRVLDDEELPGDISRAGTPVEEERKDIFTLDEEMIRDDGVRLWRHARVVPTATIVVTVETAASAVDAGDVIHDRVFAGLKTGFEGAEAAEQPAAEPEAPPTDDPEPSPADGAEPATIGEP